MEVHGRENVILCGDAADVMLCGDAAGVIDNLGLLSHICMFMDTIIPYCTTVQPSDGKKTVYRHELLSLT